MGRFFKIRLNVIVQRLPRTLFCQARLWIGVTNDSTVASDFRWQDGFPVQASQIHWAPTEPSKPKTHSRCVIVDNNGQWYVRKCLLTKAFLLAYKFLSFATTKSSSFKPLWFTQKHIHSLHFEIKRNGILQYSFLYFVIFACIKKFMYILHTTYIEFTFFVCNLFR